MNATVHEPTEVCYGQHCHVHHVDETGPSYIVCGECGHLYRTRGELRRAYRREFWQVSRRWRTSTPFPGDRPPGLLSCLRRMIMIKAEEISFCQHCIHDF